MGPATGAYWQIIPPVIQAVSTKARRTIALRCRRQSVRYV